MLGATVLINERKRNFYHYIFEQQMAFRLLASNGVTHHTVTHHTSVTNRWDIASTHLNCHATQNHCLSPKRKRVGISFAIGIVVYIWQERPASACAERRCTTNWMRPRHTR